jgi:hypothetical protein
MAIDFSNQRVYFCVLYSNKQNYNWKPGYVYGRVFFVSAGNRGRAEGLAALVSFFIKNGK